MGVDLRTALRSFIAVVALSVCAVPALASAAGSGTVPTRTLLSGGGTVTWPATVHNAKTCSWSSSPNVAGFATTVKCKSGRVERSFRFGENLSTKPKVYTLSLTIRGTVTTIDHLKVVEAGQTITTPRTTTTTTSTPTTTSTLAPTTTTTTISPTTTSSTTTSTTTTTTTLPASQSPGWTSPNWSGYVLTGGSGGYQAISAEWTVPSVDCSLVPNGATSDWVGVNGFGSQNPGLFQDGTTSYCLNGQEGDYTWWTDELEGYSNQLLFTVAPGDLIDAQVFQETSGDWAYYLEDVTTGVSATAPETFSGKGTSAEWIAEDPGDPNTNEPYPLADFGSVTFTDLGLTTPTGSWTVPTYADAIEMVGPNRSVETLPSTIQGSAVLAYFTVTYEASGSQSSGQATPAIRRAALMHPQSTFVTLSPRVVRGTLRR